LKAKPLILVPKDKGVARIYTGATSLDFGWALGREPGPATMNILVRALYF